jgi:hypothetical protein
LRTIRHIRVLLGAALLVAGIVTGCQDTSPNPATWTVGELHVDVGLAGGHQSLDCAGCHGEGSLKPALAACEDCHLESYEQVTDPNHVERGFPTQCAECHTSMAWRPARFDHEAFGFVLLGAHADLVCAACHPAGQAYSGLPTDCFGCHEADFDDAADPDHEALQLSHECTDCHDTGAWSPATFDHDLTDFVLTGAHVETVCSACHTPEVLAEAPTDCYACHEADFDDAEPDHGALELSHECTDCHDTRDWLPATFDHDLTDFALTGAHVETECSACHTPEVLAEAPTDCFGCHEADFDDAADPDHVALQLSHECTDCHDTRDWSPATFNHDLTTFALRGAHVEVTCVTCHAEGFSGTATDCIACHAEDEPRDHFGPDCSACHTDAAWEPSTFDHEPSFPLQRGNHRDYRNDCAACHTDLADYEVFTCTNCHDGEHERRETDDDHDDVSDYRYDSIACYDCHPRGDEDDAEDGDDD